MSTKYLARCARCGLHYFNSGATADCIHSNTEVYDMSDEEAGRVHARWLLSRNFNPDHDATSFRDPPALTN